MTEIQNLEMRVSRLEARTELSDLVTRYAIACDEHDMPQLKACSQRMLILTVPTG